MKNKYQDALFTLVTNSSQFLKENKLEDSQFMEWHNQSKDLLQELVDKETPMKVNKKEFLEFDCDDDFEYFPHMTFYYKCPNRKCKLHHKYELSFDTERCPICNQLLDWSDDRG